MIDFGNWSQALKTVGSDYELPNQSPLYSNTWRDPVDIGNRAYDATQETPEDIYGASATISKPGVVTDVESSMTPVSGYMKGYNKFTPQLITASNASKPLDTGTLNTALEATGSKYRVPEKVSEEADALLANSKEGAPGIMGSPLVGLVKKAAGLVASFYTGGMSGLAMNAGASLASKNNPNAGALTSMASTASKFF